MKRGILNLVIAIVVMSANLSTSAQKVAVKSNALAWLTATPTLGVEVGLADRWSLNTHVYYNPFTFKDNRKWKHIRVQPEVRYWFRPQGPRRGHYLGLMGGGGWYDLENGGRGYKGEGGMIGVSYGYQFPVGRYFAFEAGAALGYMHTEYEEYLPIDGCYVYQQTNRMNYFGPLRLRFSWVWRIGQWIEKKGGAR